MKQSGVVGVVKHIAHFVTSFYPPSVQEKTIAVAKYASYMNLNVVVYFVRVKINKFAPFFKSIKKYVDTIRENV